MIKKRLVTKNDDESECSESRKKHNFNVLQKILNRNHSGFFNFFIYKNSNDKIFKQIPSELKFCLKDIVPFCYLADHMFMGLSLCGNFLISYRRTCESESFDFNSGFKYEIYFWIFRPHMPLQRFFKRNLFDDHGTEDIKNITMCQWKSDTTTLIVHGSSEIDDQHSFISILKLPKVGCLSCKKLRDNDSTDNVFKNFDLCMQCNFTIHMKYRFNESTQNFNPRIHLSAPDHLIMCENSLIHTINFKLDMQKMKSVGRNYISYKYLSTSLSSSSRVEAGHDENSIQQPTISIVEQILADFSEFDNECPSPLPAVRQNAIDGCENNFNNITLINNLNQPKIKNFHKKTEEAASHGESSHIIKKSPASPQEMLEAAAKTYEFSEENEKCEKISLFRKRRLADKKYEFSEENTENIIPYSRMRNKITKRTVQQFHPPHTSTFRSPCGSPIPNRSTFMSPPGFRSPNYYTYRSSPTRHFLYSPPPRQLPRFGSMSPAYGNEDIHKYFSDIMNRIKDGRTESESVHEIKSTKDSPMFSKKIINYYVEEDDANSIVTLHDEDDCISPGYHLSLPMEVHGACYSKMQIVSKSSLNRLKGIPRAIITQNSFDIEHFSIHIANLLCKKNDKKYGILFDLAFEIVHVCPLSQMILCAVCLQFTASDFDRVSQCLNCSNDSDCFAHRKLYESTILFSWNLTGDQWKILDTDQLKQIASSQVKLSHPIRGNRQEILIRKLQRFIKRIFGKDRSAFDKFDHLKILDSNEDKSKDSLIDFHNGIEFYRRQPFDSPSSVSSISSNSSASGSSDSDSCDESLH